MHIQIAGHHTGFGNPKWLETHPPADKTAPCVLMLLEAGASIRCAWREDLLWITDSVSLLGRLKYIAITCLGRGTTQMDELAFSLNGENIHYGTPANPAAVGHIPGGSSSGSAVRHQEEGLVLLMMGAWIPNTNPCPFIVLLVCLCRWRCRLCLGERHRWLC